MLNIGTKAPDFSLSDATGSTVSLTALLAKGPVLLYFYPADFTPVCTKEACMFRDRSEDLVALGMSVVGVSPQSVETKRKFAASNRLTQILLADPGRKVAAVYDATALLGFVVRRVTYLIDRDSTIVDSARADLSIGAHEALVERALSRYKLTPSA